MSAPAAAPGAFAAPVPEGPRVDLPPAVPYLGRIVLVPAALAHAFAVGGLVTGWSRYRSPGLAAGLFAVSALLPVLLVAAARRGGGALPSRDRRLVVAGVLAVSVLVPADLPASGWATWAAWNWGTGAMTLLGLGAHLRPARTVTLAAVHGALAAAVAALGGAGAWGVHLVLVAAAVPPLGAAQYMSLYAGVLRARAAAVVARAEAEAGRRDLDVVQVADRRRLAALREEIEPLLDDVAERAELPLDADRSGAARRLAGQLREALAAQRRTLWLPEEVGGAPVTVVSTDAATGAADDADRAWLAALLDLLGRHRGWSAVRVVLDLRPEGSLAAVVAADGGAARAAATDRRVQVLCAGRAARCDADDGLFVVEADLSTKIGA